MDCGAGNVRYGCQQSLHHDHHELQAKQLMDDYSVLHTSPVRLQNVVDIPRSCELMKASTCARTEFTRVKKGSAFAAICGPKGSDPTVSLFSQVLHLHDGLLIFLLPLLFDIVLFLDHCDVACLSQRYVPASMSLANKRATHAPCEAPKTRAALNSHFTTFCEKHITMGFILEQHTTRHILSTM
jgi:hypothetical protein